VVFFSLVATVRTDPGCYCALFLGACLWLADGLYSPELSDRFFAVERDYGVGIASSNIEMRNKFREVYDKRVPEKSLHRLMFLVREHAWLHNMHTFWIPHALGLMLTMLDTNRSVLLGKSACQGIPVLEQSKTSGATLISDTSQRNDAVLLSQPGPASVMDGQQGGLETQHSAMNASVNMDSAPSMPEENEQPPAIANLQISDSAMVCMHPLYLSTAVW
jgi:hypothetical protein